MTASTGTAFSFFFTLILAGDYASNESVIIEYSLLLFCNAAVKSRIERLFPIVIRLPGQVSGRACSFIISQKTKHGNS